MTKRALLVGCNYPDTENELRGCWNDVYGLRDRLMSRFGFENERICVLVDKPGTSSQSMPTGANIREKLYALIRNLKYGDCVVFHFSGHGVQMPPEGEPDETGYKECIVPTDMNIITDDDFRILVDKIPDGVSFTFIADCCHSGGLIAHAKQQVGSTVFVPDLLSPSGLQRPGPSSEHSGKVNDSSSKHHGRFGDAIRKVHHMLAFSHAPHAHSPTLRCPSGQYGHFGGRQQPDGHNYVNPHQNDHDTGPLYNHPADGNLYNERHAPWEQGRLERGASSAREYALSYLGLLPNNNYTHSGGEFGPHVSEDPWGREPCAYPANHDGLHTHSHIISGGARTQHPSWGQPGSETGYNPGGSENQHSGGEGNYHARREAPHPAAWPYAEPNFSPQSAGYGHGQPYEHDTRTSYGTRKRSLPVDKLTRFLSQRAGRTVEVGNIRTNLYDIFTDKASVTCKAVVKTVLDGLKGGSRSRALNKINKLSVQFLKSKLHDLNDKSDSYSERPDELDPSGVKSIQERPDRCVLVTACQSDETASDYKPSGGGKAYGVFSHAILSVLDEHKGPIDNHRLVYEARHRLSKEYQQHPCLYSTPHKAQAVFICY